MAEGKSEDGSKYIDCPPQFVTNAEHLDVLNELIQREPIFHHRKVYWQPLTTNVTRQNLSPQTP